MTGSRRELPAAVLVCAVGAALVLFAARSSWVHEVVQRAAPLPSRRVARSGNDLSGVMRALGLLGLAGAVAVLATRRWGRVLVGALVGLAGLGVVAQAVALAVGQPAGRQVTLWPWVCAVGGVLLALAGGWTAARGRRWAAMGAKYEAPAGRPRARDPEGEMWEALDRGEDPTARPPRDGS